MSGFHIGEALRRVEGLAAGPDESLQNAAAEPAAMPTTPATSSEATPPPASAPSDSAAAFPNADSFAWPPGVETTLVACARDYPADAARWEALLHNAWQTDQPFFWTLLTCRAGGCVLVPHAEAGWAIRFDAAKATTLQDEAGLLFASEAAYRAFAGKYLAPRRSELTRLLSWSSLGVLEEQGDMSWAWVDADRRKAAAAKGGGRSA